MVIDLFNKSYFIKWNSKQNKKGVVFQYSEMGELLSSRVLLTSIVNNRYDTIIRYFYSHN